MKAHVRPIESGDVEGFRAVFDAVARERIFLSRTQASPMERVREFVNDNIENNYAQYVAEVDGEIVGWADLIPHSREALRHSAGLGMGVAKAYRGRGIGEALLRRAIDHCWRKGLTRLELEVYVDNVPAIRLYEKLGFEREGTLRNARLIDGEYRDVYVMSLLRMAD